MNSNRLEALLSELSEVQESRIGQSVGGAQVVVTHVVVELPHKLSFAAIYGRIDGRPVCAVYAHASTWNGVAFQLPLAWSGRVEDFLHGAEVRHGESGFGEDLCVREPAMVEYEACSESDLRVLHCPLVFVELYEIFARCKMRFIEHIYSVAFRGFAER